MPAYDTCQSCSPPNLPPCPPSLRARADGPLLSAVRSGAWVLLDELNLASQTVLEGLNAVLDHRAEVGGCWGCWEGRAWAVVHAAWSSARMAGGRSGCKALELSSPFPTYPPPGVHPGAQPHVPLPAHVPRVWGAEPAAGGRQQGLSLLAGETLLIFGHGSASNISSVYDPGILRTLLSAAQPLP